MAGRILNVRVHSDGSCGTPKGKGKDKVYPPGGCAAIITFPDGDADSIAVYSGAMQTTVGRMEITGVLCGLWHIRSIVNGLDGIDNARVAMVTDSKFVAQCAMGLARRKANIDLWDEYNRICLPYGVGGISMVHRPRNSTWEMEGADRIAGSVRAGLIAGVPRLVSIAEAGSVATIHPNAQPYSKPK